MVAFVCGGLGLVAVNCGGRSHGSPTVSTSGAGSGGRSGGGEAGSAPNAGGSAERGGLGAGGAGTASSAAAAAGHDAVCPCDSNDPVCVERLANSCARGAICPPTLDALLDYGKLPHEPNGLSDVSYAVCDDGTSSITVTDPFGEGGTIYVFDSRGRLLFDGDAGRSACGDWPPQDPAASCLFCEVLRTGGLDEVAQAGAGGEGGAVGAPTAPGGVPYCLVDSDGKLVMPSN